ncbi:MAG: AAA family ATPase [Acidimicrobiales bacterium]
MSRLDLIVGPNGAGKSTFVQKVIIPSWPATVFVNADEIARERWPEEAAARSHEAARVAAATRARLIEIRRPFIAETVFSHPSELELIADARAQGYFVALHVLMVPEELAGARVAHRVVAGGHDVPEEKIRARYARVWPLVAQAAEQAHTTGFWDNASFDGPRKVFTLTEGLAVGRPSWPTWTPEALTNRWPNSS